MEADDSNLDGYINASHISYPGVQTKWIAAQAPLATTLSDFWSMIIEYDVKIIVMLCNCVENGMVYFVFFVISL